MTIKRTVLQGLAQATGTVLYVALIVLFITGADRLFDSDGDIPDALIGVTMLVLFLISACITGVLILGYPAVLALRQQIRGAIMLIAATVAWLILILVILLVAIVVVAA